MRVPARDVVGIVLVDKPAGETSNRVLQRVKRLFGAQKAGHTGTLDPIATGMLPICFGAATKVAGLMLSSTKRYRVTAVFGVATDTLDASGTETARRQTQPPDHEQLLDVMRAMAGRSRQIPPMYSALKHHGRRLHDLARQGIEVEREAREIEIFELVAETLDWPRLTFSVHCSKGTYVRSLVSDLAERLGTVAHVGDLRRLSVDPFPESGMVTLDVLETAAARGESLDRWLLQPDAALADLKAVTVSFEDSVALRHGRPISIGPGDTGELMRFYDPGGGFIGLGSLDSLGNARPKRIFPSQGLG